MERQRRQGKNQRFVLVLGTGPRGQAFARKLEEHRELGLRIAGSWTTPRHSSSRVGWRHLGALDQLETRSTRA